MTIVLVAVTLIFKYISEVSLSCVFSLFCQQVNCPFMGSLIDPKGLRLQQVKEGQGEQGRSQSQAFIN